MFDSDFNSTDISGTDDTDDVEFLDTSDIDTDEEANDDSNDIMEGNGLSDDVYHATHMSEDELTHIDELWDEEPTSDVETYKAVKNDLYSDNGDIELYKASRIGDGGDLDIDLMDVSDTVEAENIESLEEQFASDIEAMSDGDLAEEQQRLEQLGSMSDAEILNEYSEQMDKYNPELFEALTSGMNKSTLKYLRDGLANGDPDVYAYFGLRDDADDNSDYERTRRK